MGAAVRIFAGLAVLALIVAAVLATRSATLVVAGSHLSAEVVRIDADRDSGSRLAYRPVLRFIDANGEPRDWVGPGESGASTFGPGDRIEVLRGTGAEPRIELNDFGRLWAGALLCVTLAWICGGVALLMRFSERETGWRLAGAFCLFFGPPFLVGGTAEALLDLSALHHGLRATGVVTNGRGVEWRLFKSGDDAGHVPAVVRMTTADGREVEFTDSQFNAMFVVQGAPVEVLYLPRRPYAAEVYEPLGHWTAALILLGIGVPFTAVGVALSRRRR